MVNVRLKLRVTRRVAHSHANLRRGQDVQKIGECLLCKIEHLITSDIPVPWKSFRWRRRNHAIGSTDSRDQVQEGCLANSSAEQRGSNAGLFGWLKLRQSSAWQTNWNYSGSIEGVEKN